MTGFQVLSLTIPPASALLAAFIAFQFASRTKRLDILYQNKVPAFKQVATSIVAFGNFCEGRVAFFLGSEYSPFYEEGGGTLSHRTQIAKDFSENAVFFSKESRAKLNNFLGEMSLLCNIEVWLQSENDIDPKGEYERMAKESELIVDMLYKELNLPSN